ncbi:MAG: hypothetical protein NTW99_03830, partial [Chloroflexi bacterium]|nr:hypothetical protein [Chloroflexota bacterium]
SATGKSILPITLSSRARRTEEQRPPSGLSWRASPSGRMHRNERHPAHIIPVLSGRQNQSAARPPPKPNPPPRLSASQACSYLAALLRVR